MSSFVEKYPSVSGLHYEPGLSLALEDHKK